MADDHQSKPGGPGYEPTDADAPRLFKIGGVLMLIIVGSMAAMFGLWKLFLAQPTPPENPVSAVAVPSGTLPPEPRLQALPTADMEAYRRWEDSVLVTYGWVDRQKGVARIPIDSAMARVVRNGLPVDTTLAHVSPAAMEPEKGDSHEKH